MRKGDYLGLSQRGFHGLVYREWGPESSERTLLCLHGLSRNGKDFGPLAERLAEEGWRVVAPDVVGRGDSDWAAGPEVYGYPQYMADVTALIARLKVEEVTWLGTSMGGLMGMMLAAQPKSPIRRLVMNDVGPFIPKAALERLADYIGKDVWLETEEEALAYARETYASFGRLDDAGWRLMAEVSFRRDVEGYYRLNYDPAIGEVLRGQPAKDLDFWSIWDRVDQPTLVLRGAESDLLLAETAEEMATRGPKAALVTFPDCGHAPSLYEKAQIDAVARWLNEAG